MSPSQGSLAYRELALPDHISALGRFSSMHLVDAFQGQAAGTAAYPTANKAFYSEIIMPAPFKVARFFTEYSATTAGNFDIAIYHADFSKIIGTGATAKGTTTTNQVQYVDVTDTPLPAGRYFLGFAHDGTVSWNRIAPTLASMLSVGGIWEQTSAYTLPDPMVPAKLTVSYMPLFGFSQSTL